MRIVLNTKYPDAVASYKYTGALKDISGITLNDFSDYNN